MAYLRKVPGSKMWYAAFKDSKGKLRNKSTQIRDEGDRKTRAANKARALGVARDLERIARGYDRNRKQMERTIQSLLEEIEISPFNSPTTRDFLNNWLESKSDVSQGTQIRYRQLVREFLDFLNNDAGNIKASKADLPVTEITPSDCDNFLRWISEKRGLSTKSENNNLKILKMPFARGLRLQILGNDPTEGIKLKPSTSVEREPFTPDEVRQLIKTCPQVRFGDEWKTAILLGYYSGDRTGDATHMRWSSVDLKKGFLTYIPEKSAKTQRELITPIHPELLEHLKSLPPPEKPDDYITPNLVENAGTRGNVSKLFSRLRARAGIENKMKKSNTKKGGRRVSTKPFHSLRHSAASQLAQAGVPAEISSLITGHKDLKVHARYTHYTDEIIAEAVKKIPNVLD